MTVAQFLRELPTPADVLMRTGESYTLPPDFAPPQHLSARFFAASGVLVPLLTALQPAITLQPERIEIDPARLDALLTEHIGAASDPNVRRRNLEFLFTPSPEDVHALQVLVIAFLAMQQGADWTGITPSDLFP